MVIAVVVGTVALLIGFIARITTESIVGGESVELALAGTTKGTFVVSSEQRALDGGAMRGLFPGGAEKLVLTVTNPNSFEIIVRSITVDAEDASNDCASNNLLTRDYSGPPVSVPKKGFTRVAVEVAMRSNADDECRGATFPLQFGGTATKK